MNSTGGDSLAAKPVDLDAVRKLTDQSTPGPWFADPDAAWGRVTTKPDGYGMIVTSTSTSDHQARAHGDHRLIAEARTLVPAMVAEIEALRAVAAASLIHCNAIDLGFATKIRPDIARRDVFIALRKAGYVK